MSITMHRACSRGMHGSATVGWRGVIPEPRVDLNAFWIICFAWREHKPPRLLVRPTPGALKRAA